MPELWLGAVRVTAAAAWSMLDQRQRDTRFVSLPIASLPATPWNDDAFERTIFVKAGAARAGRVVTPAYTAALSRRMNKVRRALGMGDGRTPATGRRRTEGWPEVVRQELKL